MARRGKQKRDATQLDSAVRKVEGREREQDKRKGKTGKAVRSTGRTIRDGWREGA